MKEHLKGCVNSHYFLASFILFPTCPRATIDPFLLVFTCQVFLSTFSIVNPSHPFLGLSTLELVVWSSTRLEKNQIQCCSYKEKKNLEVPLQRQSINREQLLPTEVQLPSKCSVFPVFHLLYTSTLIQRLSVDLTRLRLHLFRNIGFLYVPDTKGIIYILYLQMSSLSVFKNCLPSFMKPETVQ